LEYSKVLRFWCQGSLIKTNEEVKYTIAIMTSKGFCISLDNKGNSRVLDGNSIERLEIMNKLERLPIFLENIKPARAIGGAQRFINSCSNFSFDNVDNTIKNSRGNRDITDYP
jgi:hypothetical protein